MEKYVFYDYDLDDGNEYFFDITGDDYKRLIETCCKYGAVVSFAFFREYKEISLAKELEPYQINRPDNITCPLCNNKRFDLIREAEIRYYRVCPELYWVLTHYISGIYQWTQEWHFSNPEDPTFYREDGSVLFTSIIHDGDLFLTPIEDEDVSDILSVDGWRKQ